MLRLFFFQVAPHDIQFLLRQPADPRSLQCGSVFEMLKHFKEYAVCRPRFLVQYPSVNQIELDDSLQRRNAVLATRRMVRGKETRKAWALSYVVCDGVFNPPVARWLQGNTLGYTVILSNRLGLLSSMIWNEAEGLRDVDGFEHCSLEIGTPSIFQGSCRVRWSLCKLHQFVKSGHPKRLSRPLEAHSSQMSKFSEFVCTEILPAMRKKIIRYLPILPWHTWSVRNT